MSENITCHVSREKPDIKIPTGLLFELMALWKEYRRLEDVPCCARGPEYKCRITARDCDGQRVGGVR